MVNNSEESNVLQQDRVGTIGSQPRDARQCWDSDDVERDQLVMIKKGVEGSRSEHDITYLLSQIGELLILDVYNKVQRPMIYFV